MTWSNVLNGSAAVLALLIGLGVSALGEDGRVAALSSAASSADAVTDAEGHVVHVRPFRRIASASIVADPLLLELAEPDRVLAYTAWESDNSPTAWRYSGRGRIASAADVESILGLKPDLFLVNNIGAPAELAPLRNAGVEVFDLGEMRGLSTLLANARVIATLLGHPERGERFAERFSRRFEAIAAEIPASRRSRALYVSVYGAQLLGGTIGTSFHDVLVHAGLVDVAAERYANWPQYSAEQVLEMNPDVIVTHVGMTSQLCRGAGLEHVSACARGSVVEVESALLDDPGVLMFDAAESIHSKVYGPRPALAGTAP